MPIAAFACPPGKPTFGEQHDVEHCITQCQHQCYSPFLMAAIAAVNQKNHHKGRYVSATALPSCKRRLRAERELDYAPYYEECYAAFRGTITHTVIEEAATVVLSSGKSLVDYGFVLEWNMKVGFCLREGHGGFPIPADTDVDDLATYAQLECPVCTAEGLPSDLVIILGGTLDGSQPLWHLFDAETGVLPCKLHDIKTQKEYALRLFVKGDPKNTLHPAIKDDYVKQARVYAYLASRSTPPASLVARGVKQVVMVESHIQAFAMGEAPWTGGGPFVWKDDYRHPFKPWPMYPIDLGTVEWVEEYIRSEAREILDTLVLRKSRGTVAKPDRSSKGSHSWLCDFCAFHGSEVCPNPRLEYDLVADGMDPEAAFEYASHRPIEVPAPTIEPTTDEDTRITDNFFRKQRGEEPVEKAAKPKKEPAPKKPRAPRKSAKKADE
jgi:hypothetical protein